MNFTGAYWRGDARTRQPAAYLRHRIPQEGRAGRLPQHAGRGQEARPPQAGQGAGAVLSLAERRPGLPFFLPKGMMLKNTLDRLLARGAKEYGYEEISTPHHPQQGRCGSAAATGTTTRNMYTTVIDGEDYSIKPMNCPGGMLVYRRSPIPTRSCPCVGGVGSCAPPRAVRRELHGLTACAASRRTTPTSS